MSTTAPPETLVLTPKTLLSREDAPEHGLYRWTRSEYRRMAQAGLFDDIRVELLDGEIWKRPAQLTPHAVAVTKVHRALEAAFGSGSHVRNQLPIVLDDSSEPEPDIAVVHGLPEDYMDDHPHPDQILLLLEVSDTPLRKDRGRKVADYGAAGISDYWIINLVNRQLEVYRDPSHSGGYQSIQILGPTKSIVPLHAPAAEIPVADLLPPQPSQS